MTISRRTLLRLAAGSAALAVAPTARTETYPARPVRIIAGYPPGGIVDIYARLIAVALSERLGRQFIVENRPGAGGTLGASEVAKSPPDGYTLLLFTSADTWNATLYRDLNFDVTSDLVPVAAVARGPGLLVVNPSMPVKSVPELIAAAKARPGTITVASAGVGSAPFMYWELFRSATGVDMVHVPYHGGGPALTDLLGGQVQVYFGTFASTLDYAKTGRLRALGVTSATRAAVLPDVPALAEFLPGFEASIFVGLAAPRDTASDIAATLNRTTSLALADPQIRQRIAEFGDMPLPLSVSDFAKLAADETEKWRKVIRAANVKAE